MYIYYHSDTINKNYFTEVKTMSENLKELTIDEAACISPFTRKFYEESKYTMDEFDKAALIMCSHTIPHHYKAKVLNKLKSELSDDYSYVEDFIDSYFKYVTSFVEKFRLNESGNQEFYSELTDSLYFSFDEAVVRAKRYIEENPDMDINDQLIPIRKLKDINDVEEGDVLLIDPLTNKLYDIESDEYIIDNPGYQFLMTYDESDIPSPFNAGDVVVTNSGEVFIVDRFHPEYDNVEYLNYFVPVIEVIDITDMCLESRRILATELVPFLDVPIGTRLYMLSKVIKGDYPISAISE